MYINQISGAFPFVFLASRFQHAWSNAAAKTKANTCKLKVFIYSNLWIGKLVNTDQIINMLCWISIKFRNKIN